MRKLNIKEDVVDDRKQQRQLKSRPTQGKGKLGMITDNDDEFMESNTTNQQKIIISSISNSENKIKEAIEKIENLGKT